MSDEKQIYEKLCETSRDIQVLKGIGSLLHWDQETYLPSDAAQIRSDQIKILTSLVHKASTGKPYAKILGQLVDLKTGKLLHKNFSPDEKASLREWYREYRIEKALPKKFVEEQAKLTSQAPLVWRHAKHEDAFQTFAPFLDKIITLARKKADYLGYKDHPYDALLDLYEPGFTKSEVSELFMNLREAIGLILKKLPKQSDDSFLFGNFSKEKQLSFAKELLDAMKYDFKKGRLDISEHPFSSASHPTDSRITTKIHPTSLMSNIFAVLHEAGHALYEMGLPTEYYGTPLAETRSLGIHESQSRWWETRIGHSKAFWKYFLPILKSQFKTLEKISIDQFYGAINKVEPSFIRIEADEVTYGLHIILRFELEVALIEGRLKIRDLPEAWNAKMKDLLGITPENNAMGCLQDIHWSMGAIGYFPTYTLGNLYAGHFFQAFEKRFPDWEKRVAEGDLGFIKDWLHENVYKHGKRYSSKELLENATGKPFSSDAYISYLNKKYK